MLTIEFSKLLTSLSQLTKHQCEKIITTIQSQGHNTIDEFLDKNSKNSSTCPYCQSTHITCFGRRNGIQRYRCKNCLRTFNSLTGTPLAHLRHKESWQTFSQDLINSSSVKAAAVHCHVQIPTAFRWRHRFLKLPSDMQPQRLVGITEVDETYFLGSMKGQRNLLRKPRKRGGKATKRGISKEQDCVFIARDRNGYTMSILMKTFNSDELKKILQPRVASDNILCSDGLKVYKALSKKCKIAHKSLNIKAKIRVIGKAFHIQNVNAYDSRLHNWMSKFHGVATRYLSNYLGWFRVKDFLKNTYTINDVLRGALGVSYQPLTLI